MVASTLVLAGASSTQKLTVGSEPALTGTVVENITKYAPVDGPAFLTIRIDDGAQIRVTYSPGEAECHNTGAADVGFAVKAGDRIEVRGKAISDHGLFTCESGEYYIKVLGHQTHNAGFTLDFYAGGSLFGSSFEIQISGAHITYREIPQGNTKEVSTIERPLFPVELDDLRKTIMDADLSSLRSQDITKEPLMPDQAYYRISLSLDGKENTIRCGIPPSGTEPTTECQKRINPLRLKLNHLLGVNIY